MLVDQCKLMTAILGKGWNSQAEAGLIEKENSVKPGPTILGVATPWSIPREDDGTVPDGWKATEDKGPNIPAG